MFIIKLRKFLSTPTLLKFSLWMDVICFLFVCLCFWYFVKSHDFSYLIWWVISTFFFLNVEPALHARSKFHLVMVYNYFKILLILFDNIFRSSLYQCLLAIMVYIFFSYNIVIWFWYYYTGDLIIKKYIKSTVFAFIFWTTF